MGIRLLQIVTWILPRKVGWSGEGQWSKVLLSFLDLCKLKLPRTLLRALEAIQPQTWKDHPLSLSDQSPRELHKESQPQ